MAKSQGTLNNIFGTLPKQYCLWFYILCVLSFLVFIFLFLYFLYLLFTKGRKIDNSLYVVTLSTSISYLFVYLTYRLLYNMCINSLR